MDMVAPVYRYCERGLDLGVWAEPSNALSNAAFVILACAAARHSGATSADISLQDKRALRGLAVSAAAVGVGSLLFHTWPRVWTQIADVVPIGIFVGGALWLFCRWIVGTSRNQAALAIVVLAGTSTGLALLAVKLGCHAPRLADGRLQPMATACLNGGWSYLPIGLILAASAMVSPRPGWFAIALVSFVVGFAARTIDLNWCATSGALWLTGHMIWHLATAMAAYSVLRGLLANAPRTKLGSM